MAAHVEETLATRITTSTVPDNQKVTVFTGSLEVRKCFRAATNLAVRPKMYFAGRGNHCDHFSLFHNGTRVGSSPDFLVTGSVPP